MITIQKLPKFMEKIRADQLLVLQNLAESRQKAQRLILAGEVWSGDRRIEKAGQMLPDDLALEVRSSNTRFVSRGGDKLDGALDELGIDVKDLVCADVGSSTGGFTHCLLERGARRVYALDVGRGQLHQKMHDDNRVISLEGINCRYLNGDEIPEQVDLITIDVSFISALKVIPGARKLLAPNGRILSLVKPQFEAGREKIQRGGLVRDPKVHAEVLVYFSQALCEQGAKVIDLCRAAVAGTKGNQEYFIFFEYINEPSVDSTLLPPRISQKIKELVNDDT
jgi:23S rRNA (cytidine1920-2'-O)/16S rRNA (cytidine1409-2'-O)-methyltransferase